AAKLDLPEGRDVVGAERHPEFFGGTALAGGLDVLQARAVTALARDVRDERGRVDRPGALCRRDRRVTIQALEEMSLRKHPPPGVETGTRAVRVLLALAGRDVELRPLGEV